MNVRLKIRRSHRSPLKSIESQWGGCFEQLRAIDSVYRFVWDDCPIVFLSWFRWTRLHSTFVYQSQANKSFRSGNFLFTRCIWPCVRVSLSTKWWFKCCVYALAAYDEMRSTMKFRFLFIAFICASMGCWLGGLWLCIDHTIHSSHRNSFNHRRTFHQKAQCTPKKLFIENPSCCHHTPCTLDTFCGCPDSTQL